MSKEIEYIDIELGIFKRSDGVSLYEMSWGLELTEDQIARLKDGFQEVINTIREEVVGGVKREITHNEMREE